MGWGGFVFFYVVCIWFFMITLTDWSFVWQSTRILQRFKSMWMPSGSTLACQITWGLRWFFKCWQNLTLGRRKVQQSNNQDGSAGMIQPINTWRNGGLLEWYMNGTSVARLTLIQLTIQCTQVSNKLVSPLVASNWHSSAWTSIALRCHGWCIFAVSLAGLGIQIKCRRWRLLLTMLLKWSRWLVDGTQMITCVKWQACCQRGIHFVNWWTGVAMKTNWVPRLFPTCWSFWVSGVDHFPSLGAHQSAMLPCCLVMRVRCKQLHKQWQKISGGSFFLRPQMHQKRRI